MKLLSSLARALVRPDFTASLRAATTPDEVVGLVAGVVAPKPAPAAAARRPPLRPPAPARGRGPAAPAAPAAARTPVVAVTACPTGIAHTYMAADSLVAAGERAGVDRDRRDAGLVRLDAARAPT